MLKKRNIQRKIGPGNQSGGDFLGFDFFGFFGSIKVPFFNRADIIANAQAFAKTLTREISLHILVFLELFGHKGVL